MSESVIDVSGGLDQGPRREISLAGKSWIINSNLLPVMGREKSSFVLLLLSYLFYPLYYYYYYYYYSSTTILHPPSSIPHL